MHTRLSIEEGERGTKRPRHLIILHKSSVSKELLRDSI
jgi:hypothetical protein